MSFFNFTLRQALLIPFMSLTLLLSVATVMLSYFSGVKAVDTIGLRLGQDVATRVNQYALQHLAAYQNALDGIAPEPLGSLGAASYQRFAFPQDLLQVEARLWAASSAITAAQHRLSYTFADGRMVSLIRKQGQAVEIQLIGAPGALQENFASARTFDRSRMVSRQDNPLPLQADSYLKAAAQGDTLWLNPSIDAGAEQFKLVKVRPIYDARDLLQGVLSVEMPLQSLIRSDKRSALTQQSQVYIADRNGTLIDTATSSASVLVTESRAWSQANLNLQTKGLIPASFKFGNRAIQQLMNGEIASLQFSAPEIGHTYMAVTRLHDDAGIDWLTVVAVPRSDLMGDVEQSIWISLMIVLCLALTVLGLGAYILDWISSDLRRIHFAALKLAKWEKATPINIRPRNDEIGQLAKSFEVMEQGLMHDTLSGLLNREAFTAKANFHIANRETKPFAVLFLDLNLFKQVNDTLGHAAGDQVLQITAKRLTDTLRETDSVARFGGDEFVVLARSVASEAAVLMIRQKLLQAIEQVIVLENGHAVNISSAIGAAIFPRDGEDLDSLLRKADADMYVQKQRNRSV